MPNSHSGDRTIRSLWAGESLLRIVKTRNHSFSAYTIPSSNTANAAVSELATSWLLTSDSTATTALNDGTLNSSSSTCSFRIFTAPKIQNRATIGGIFKMPEEQHDVSDESDDDEHSDSVTESSGLQEEPELCQFITKARNSAKLTDRHKAILSFLLVCYVWQYYDTSLEDWSNKAVQFMSERIGLDSSSEVVYVNQPFLYSRFYKKILEATDSINTADKGSVRKGGLKKLQPAPKVRKVQELKLHTYPKILALGIMLLEIQLGRKLECFKTPDYYDQDLKVAHHLLALDLLKDKKLWPPENAWVAIKEIIEICIDNKKARKTFGNDSLMVRQRLYEQIVAPFHVFILEAWKPKGIEDVDPVTLEKAKCVREDVTQTIESLSATVPIVQIPAPPSPRMVEDRASEQESVSKIWLGGTMSAELSISSEKWFRDLDELIYRLSFVGERDKNCPPTKIAILDTGITEEWYKMLSEYIKEYKDFVSNNDKLRQDGTGHGTMALRLLLKLYDDAEVYAITHAKKHWKVDIICLPSGFNPDLRNPPYRDQLYNAVIATPVDKSDPRTLICAAASNLGFASKVTYPGCLSRSSKVLCLFSTADGDPDRPGFNPTAVPNTYNFALLGDDIQIHPQDQPTRGTSFSTIIAGAIAAHIIDFSNRSDTKDNILDVWYLREVEGMTSIFASMKTVKKNGYHILEPWKLKEHYQSKALDRKELRQEICRNISKALRTRNDRDYS
ncbi:hypothetical protein B0O99DRAFT_684037 [Bisporella sp. PMI_857]|nr:hypothetical protein B0O99DRAFT_684037 [Bisporella sp. PMI_857]